MIAVLATMLVSAASRPEGAKFGFCFSVVMSAADGAALSTLKAAFCEGRGAWARFEGMPLATGEVEYFLTSRLGE